MKKVLAIVLSALLLWMAVPIGTLSVSAASVDDLTYVVADGEVTIVRCDPSAAGSLEIPATIEGLPVTAIGEEAFYGCAALTAVTIPASVTSVGSWAFYYCSSLTEVTVGGGVIGANAFTECAALSKVSLGPDVTAIGEWVFGGCAALTEVVIPDSVTVIGEGAFANCTALASATLSSQLTAIADLTFYGCDVLTSMVIPASITSIGKSAFFSCDALSAITLPESLDTIGDYAFADCSALQNVYYTGVKAQFAAMVIGVENEDLTDAVWHYHWERHTYDNACDALCNGCDFVREVPDHVYAGAETTAPTCGAEGVKTYTCSVCGHSYTEAIPATGAHVYDNACDTACNLCGTTREVPDHVYDNACDVDCNVCGLVREVPDHVYTDACDTDCDVCGDSRTAPHVYDNACDADCNLCGATREVPDHAYEDAVTTAPTCGAEGVKTYTCSVCGHSYTEAIPATGAHVYDNACDADCNACGATREVPDHAYVGEETTAPTCGAEGVKTYTCSECGDSYTETIPATGAHVYDNACDADCNVCGTTREVADHAYVGEETTAPTCGAEGVKTYTCSECGHSYTEAIPATGAHVYDNACDTDCNACGTTREVADHAYVGEETTAPTCGAEGVKTYTCSECGHSYTETIPATGAHVYDNACDADCNACGTTREVPDHVYDDEHDTDCNECGFIREVSTVLIGDMNGDGKVNNRDLGLFQQYLNDWNVTIVIEAADTNGDGKINNRDLGLFQQYLNDWNVTLG